MPVVSAIQPQLKDHEQWLIGLRQDSCMTLDKIRIELENQKGVSAKPHQLETYFRNLGQRKNLSRPDWIKVFCTLDSQKAFGRHFDLYISGKLITERNLQKKRKNAKPAQPLAGCLADANQLLNQLPDGVTVKPRLLPGTPRGSLRHSTPAQPILHTSPDVNPDGEASLLLDSLLADGDHVPGASVVMHDTTMISGSVDSRSPSTSSANQAQLQLFSVNMEALPTFELNYDNENFGMDYGNPFFSTGFNFGDNWTGRLSPVTFLQSLQSPDRSNQNDIWSAGLHYASPTSVTPGHRTHEISLIESARLLVEGTDSVIIRRERYALHALSPSSEEVLDNLQSLASEVDFSGPLNAVGGPGLFTNQFVQLFLFSIANNFAGLGGISAEMIINLINQHEPVRSSILHHLNETSTIFSRALAEKLLQAAIKACDANTVRDLLALGIVKLDDIVCTDHSQRTPTRRTPTRRTPTRRTPIEMASILQHFDIVEVLLQFGADVNKTYEDEEHGLEQGALQCAIHSWVIHHPADNKLVDLLLSNGATVNGKLMRDAVFRGDAELIEKLVSRLPPSEHEYCVSHMLLHAAEHLRNDTGHKFIRHVVEACRDTHDNACLNSNQRVLAMAMCKAARRNNHSLVDLLLPHGGQEGLDLSLIAATQFGSHSLVRFLIAHGARVNGRGRACRIDGRSPSLLPSSDSHTTPLAEAIRRNDAELVDILAKAGAWNQIGEPGRLLAATKATAEAGNLPYLLRILQSVSDPSPEALTPALIAAIRARHEEHALRLLEAGADVNELPYSHPNDSALVEALRAKSQSITLAILESTVEVDRAGHETALEAATAWGNLEIIQALVFMGADTNTFRQQPPLSIAIKAGDRPLIDLLIRLGPDLSISSERKLPSWQPTCLSPGRSSEPAASPLATAVLVRDAETANYLLDHGADPADEQAILNAITHDRSLLNLILQTFHKRYPNGRTGFGGKVLHHALRTHDEAVLDLCLTAGFDVNNMAYDELEEYDYVTALGLAIRKYRGGRLESISKLLDSGGDANLPASDEREWDIPSIPGRQTAFLDAIETKSLPLIELLITKGADVQKKAKLGLKRTPLQKACEVGSHTIVELLLAHNADVNEAPATRGGATALQLAAKAGSVRIAKKLLDLGAKVDAPGVRLGGRSAIEYAAEHGRLGVIPVLCNAAGRKFGPGQYESAISLAQKNGHAACAMLLAKFSSGSQEFIDSGRVAGGGGRANVVC